MTTILRVGPDDIPVLGEADIPVQINNRQLSVHFLVADIVADEALLGHPFLIQAQALHFGNHCIVLFREEVPYVHTQRKPKVHAGRAAQTVVLEAGQEYLVGDITHFRRPVKGEVLLSPTSRETECWWPMS